MQMSLLRIGVFLQSMFTKNNLAGPKTIGTEMLNSVKLQEKKINVYFLNTVKPNFSALTNLSKTTGLWSEKNHFKEQARIYKLPLFKNCVNISLKILD